MKQIPSGAKIRKPALLSEGIGRRDLATSRYLSGFVAGEFHAVTKMYRQDLDRLEEMMPPFDTMEQIRTVASKDHDRAPKREQQSA